MFTLVLRHTDAYNYNNIWIRGSVRQPGDTASRSQRYDLSLADNEKGWMGSGMDDIYEHRIEIQHLTKFDHPGTYSFTLEQIMREDPLKHVLNVGVRGHERSAPALRQKTLEGPGSNDEQAGTRDEVSAKL